MGRKRSCGFFRIFTEHFFLFQVGSIHREIKEEWKSGKRILRRCRVEYWCSTTFSIKEDLLHFIPHIKFYNELMNL